MAPFLLPAANDWPDVFVVNIGAVKRALQKQQVAAQDPAHIYMHVFPPYVHVYILYVYTFAMSTHFVWIAVHNWPAHNEDMLYAIGTHIDLKAPALDAPLLAVEETQPQPKRQLYEPGTRIVFAALMPRLKPLAAVT